MGEGRARRTIGNWLAPSRFIVFILLFLAISLGTWPLSRDFDRCLMIAFDLAAIVFLVSLRPILAAGDAASMRLHAIENDANRIGLLIITGVVMLVILAAVATELTGRIEGWARLLVLATLAIAWLFSNMIYALHYAHLWYGADGASGRDRKGLVFPGTEQPDYWDFVYFAYTLGMTFQTSDVTISDRSMRRLATVHSFAAFVFNLGVIAFTINVLGAGR